MSRNIHFGFNSFVNDNNRFEESKNYEEEEGKFPSPTLGVKSKT